MMSLKIPKIKKNEQLFFLAYMIYMFFSILMHSFYFQYYANIYKLIIFVCITLLLFQEISKNKISKWAFRGAVLLYAIALLIIFRGSGNLQTAFACLFIFAFSARDIEFEKICRYTTLITLSLLAFVVLSSFIGVIPNYKSETTSRIRYYLGFRYALHAPTFFLNALLLFIYYKKDKIKIIELIIMGVIAFGLYYFTDSRLTFFISMVALVVAIINKIRKDNYGNVNKIFLALIPSYLICCVLSVILTLLYNPNTTWMANLNAFLGNRLRFGQKSLLLYGIKMFGDPTIEWVGAGLDMYGQRNQEAYFYVDNLYIQILQRYGLVFLVVFLILITALMVQCYKKKENFLLIILAICAVRGMIDDLILYLHFNTVWLLFGPALFGYIQKKRSIGHDMRKRKRKRIALRKV